MSEMANPRDPLSARGALNAEIMRPWSVDGLRVSFASFDPDEMPRPVISTEVPRKANDDEMPIHKHRKGQLVVSALGSITCRTLDGIRIVPSNGAVWVPGGIAHRIAIPENGRSYCMFIEPSVAPLPNVCATFSISRMLRHMIIHMANLPPLYPIGGATSRLAQVILDELAHMKAEPLHFPTTSHPKLERIVEAFLESPADRRSMRDWAKEVAVSERTLARLVLKHTGMTFGRWRQQLHIVLAMEKLGHGETVQTISQDLGYDSPSAFTAMFKKFMGQPPRKYLQDLLEAG